MPVSSNDLLRIKQNLIGCVGQYLAALVLHDPSRLPVADNCRFTENTKELSLGEGLWKMASKRQTILISTCSDRLAAGISCPYSPT
jgi:hypothetical protein